MRKIILLFIVLTLSIGLAQANTEPNTLPTPASNQIIYRSSDHQKIMPHKTDVFGATYIDDQSVYYADADYGIITFDDNVTVIGAEAFRYCGSLTEIVFPNTVTSIGVRAFQSCAGMKELTIPSTVTAIEIEAFNGCQNLKKLTVKAGSIGAGAFGGCTSLRSIEFGKSVMGIATSSFSNCPNVESVTFLGVVVLNNIFEGFGTADSPVALKLPSFWPVGDKPANSETPWHGGYFNCEYTDPLKELLGTLGTEQNGPALIVTDKDGKDIILYSPKSVKYVNPHCRG